MQGASKAEVGRSALRSRRFRMMRCFDHLDRQRLQLDMPGAHHERGQRRDKARMVSAGRTVANGFEVLLNASDLMLNCFPSKQTSCKVERLCTDFEYLVACKGAEPTANRQRAHGVLTGGAGNGCPRRDVPRTVGCARFPHALEDDFADCGSCALDEPECATGLIDRSEQGVERLMSLPTDSWLAVNVGQRNQCVPLTQRQFGREWRADQVRIGSLFR